MAEPYRDRDSQAPQNPPNSVVNPDVRSKALWSYLGPIALFFVVIGVALVYWANRPPQRDIDAERDLPRAEGTAGEAPVREATPGGGEPQPTPGSTRDEIESRAGATITELGGVLEHDLRTVAGRRVEVHDVDVERVESPTLFWVRDGNARVAVVAAEGAFRVEPGQTVNVTGVVERGDDTVRIRASHISASKSP